MAEESRRPTIRDVSADRVFTETDRNKLFASTPKATIIIGGVPAKCVLDTGAETSMISLDFYSKHLVNKVGKLDDVGTFIKLLGANNLEIPVDGYLETSVEIKGHGITASFVVSRAGGHPDAAEEDSRCPILLGCNVLRKIACNPNCLKACKADPDWDLALRWIKSVEDTIDGSEMAKSDVFVYDILTRDTETIAPKTARTVDCSLSRPLAGEAGESLLLIHQCPFSTVGDVGASNGNNPYLSCQVVEGADRVAKGDVFISLLIENLGSEACVVPPLTKIGEAREVQLSEQVVLDSCRSGIEVSVRCMVSDNSPVLSNDVDIPKPSGLDCNGSGTHYVCNQHRDLFVFPDGEEFLLPPGVSLGDLNASEAVIAAELIRKHEDAFSKDSLDLGFSDLIPHEISVDDNKPVNLPYRRITPGQMAEVKNLLQDLLDRNLIDRMAVNV